MGTRRNLVPIFICDATSLPSHSPFSMKDSGVPIPFDGFTQAFTKIHLNLVSQLPFSEPDISQRVPDVSRALRSIPDLALVTGKLAQDGCRLIERDLRIRGNIEERPETASAGAWAARRFACATFSMKVKSRLCSPPPQMVGISPASI